MIIVRDVTKIVSTVSEMMGTPITKDDITGRVYGADGAELLALAVDASEHSIAKAIDALKEGGEVIYMTDDLSIALAQRGYSKSPTVGIVKEGASDKKSKN